jgi:hypothetical protein
VTAQLWRSLARARYCVNFLCRSQRSELEQQLSESKAMCGQKQRELDAKRELIAQVEQQLMQKDTLIRQETKRLDDAKMRSVRHVALSTPLACPRSPPPRMTRAASMCLHAR